ncbi:hypothetical protein OF846_005310 [Rhodotorula toruloides]|nr:hypothetical protein OF846_005310 [Rhodotorula toruloides]
MLGVGLSRLDSYLSAVLRHPLSAFNLTPRLLPALTFSSVARSSDSAKRPGPSSSTPVPLKDRTKRLRDMPTHFLALPLTNTPRVVSQLADTLPLLRNALPPDVPLQAMRPIGTIHLTLGALHLQNDEQLERAKRWLQEEVDVEEMLRRAGEAARVRREEEHMRDDKADAVSLEPLVVDLRSLKSMKHQPARSVAILYLSPSDPTNRLQAFAQALHDAAVDAGLMRKPDPTRREVLLHATIVNTRYSSSGHRPTRYDFSSVISRFEEAVWATGVPINGVALCKMGAKPTEDGDAEYEVVAWRSPGVGN